MPPPRSAGRWARAAVSLATLVALAGGCGEGSPGVPRAAAPAASAAAAAAPAPVPAVADQARPGRPLILVGLDGADWQLLDRLVAAGRMPRLAALERQGTAGVLLTQHPPLSPLVWTTIATGVGPLVHRVLDFTRFDPGSGVKEPIGSRDRRAPALWNMATWAGREVAVLGLWATYPAEPVRGLLVSDRLFSFLHQEESPPPGVAFPPEREDWARAILRQVEGAVGLEPLRAYLPWLSAEEFDSRREGADPYAHPVSALRRILVETEVYRRLAREWLEERRPDLTVLYVQGTDSIGHVFAPFAPPPQPGVAEEDYRRYHGVAEAYFAAVDGLVGELADLARARGAVLLLASDHGFSWSEGRPTALSSFAVATAAKWHRPEGMYLLAGPGIAARPGRERAGVAQVAATALEILGLPPGEGLAGPPLPPIAASDRPRVDYAALFAAVPPPAPPPAAAAAAREEIAKLRALGYIGEAEPASADRGRTAPERTAGSYNNEGLILKEQGRIEEAVAAFEEALARDPALASALWNLSDLLYGQGRDLDRSDRLLAEALGGNLPEGDKLLIGRAMAYQRSGRPQRSLRLLDAAVAARSGDLDLLLFRGRYRIEARDCAGALADFQQAIVLDPARAVGHASAGLAQLCLGNPAAAAAAFRRSLALDPDQPQIRRYLEDLARGPAGI